MALENCRCSMMMIKLVKRSLQKKGLRFITQSFYRQKVESVNLQELVKDDRQQNTW